MDLIKMHPMARKMTAHNEELAKAIEDGNADVARQHIMEIIKYASTLEDDLLMAVKKGENEVVVPDNSWQVMKFNQSGANFDPSMRGDQLPGTIIPARTKQAMRPVRGTFGRRV
jgi:hypothetical protein